MASNGLQVSNEDRWDIMESFSYLYQYTLYIDCNGSPTGKYIGLRRLLNNFLYGIGRETYTNVHNSHIWQVGMNN